MSNGSSSDNKKALSAFQNLAGNLSKQPTFNYESLDVLYDKLLEDEDKILLLKQKRENKLHKKGGDDQDNSESDDNDSHRHSSLGVSDESDLLD